MLYLEQPENRTLRRADFRRSFWDVEITHIVVHRLQQPFQTHSVSGCRA